MAGRVLALCSVLMMLALIAGCGGSNAQLSGVTITPATVAFEDNIQSPYFQPTNQTAQFTATGTYTNGKNGKMYTADITDQVVWETTGPTVVTINSSGLATPTGCGSVAINAKAGNGGLVASAQVTVCTTSGGIIPGGGGAGTLTSIDVIPTNQTVENAGETAQYIAIGNFTGNPSTQDLTNQVTWSSSDVQIGTINSAGLATAVGNCTNGASTTITALSPPSMGAVAGTAMFTTNSCGSNNLPSLTVYEVGQGSGTITSSPPGINCTGPNGGAGCTANYVLGTGVSLTAVAAPGSVFVGWSANCMPDNGATCMVTMVDNQTVGAIFNLASQ